MDRDIEQTVDQLIGRTVGMRESHLQEHVRQAALYGPLVVLPYLRQPPLTRGVS